jgi:hypothetical protein
MMIGKKDQKNNTLAARARAKAVEDAMMQAPSRRAMASDKPPMAPPAAMSSPDMSSPNMAPPMGMKKGGAVKKKTTAKNAMKAPPKKGGLMIMIALGKKKGR